jgi:hypothetical protein
VYICLFVVLVVHLPNGLRILSIFFCAFWYPFILLNEVQIVWPFKNEMFDCFNLDFGDFMHSPYKSTIRHKIWCIFSVSNLSLHSLKSTFHGAKGFLFLESYLLLLFYYFLDENNEAWGDKVTFLHYPTSQVETKIVCGSIACSNCATLTLTLEFSTVSL